MDKEAKEIVEDFVNRIGDAIQGGAAKPLELVDRNLATHVIGTTPVSGFYPTLEAFLGVAFQTVLERIKPSTWSLGIKTLVGSGNRVAAYLDIKGQTVFGQTYNERGWPTGFIFTLSGGKIVQMTIFPDTEELEKVIFGRRFVPNSEGEIA